MEDNLALYHIFNSVAQAGNISKAARQLYISQPAVSKAIQNLEKNLKTTLFIRNSRGVRLTEEGELLYRYTSTAFDTLRHAEDSIRRIHELGIGHLRIGASNTLCKYLLLPYLKSFVKEYPHIKITIENQSSLHTIKQLDNDNLDIGLVARPDNLDNYHFISLGEIEDIFVATRTYLENLKLRENSSDIFNNANIMLLDEANVTRQHIDAYFKANSIEPRHILEISSMDLLIDFAKTGLGVACVIKAFVQADLDAGFLVEIPLANPINKREVGFIYSKKAFLSESMLRFLSFIDKHNQNKA